jgi:hypothetical protein
MDKNLIVGLKGRAVDNDGTHAGACSAQDPLLLCRAHVDQSTTVMQADVVPTRARIEARARC